MEVVVALLSYFAIGGVLSFIAWFLIAILCIGVNESLANISNMKNGIYPKDIDEEVFLTILAISLWPLVLTGGIIVFSGWGLYKVSLIIFEQLLKLIQSSVNKGI